MPGRPEAPPKTMRPRPRADPAHLASRSPGQCTVHWSRDRGGPPMSKSIPAISLQHLSEGLTDIVTRAAPSVVAVHSPRARSSGFFWRPGLIVTADEALADEGAIEVVIDGGKRMSASIAGRDPTTDIVVLRTGEAMGSAVQFGSSSVVAGSLAAVVGAQDGGPVAAVGG